MDHREGFKTRRLQDMSEKEKMKMSKAWVRLQPEEALTTPQPVISYTEEEKDALKPMTATRPHCATCLAAFATAYLFDHHVCPGRPGTSTTIVEAFDPDVDGDPSELNASRRLDF